jgi:hypothetical protein
MKKRGCKAQLKLSFGMLFSILVIIVFIIFAFLGIKRFVSVHEDLACRKLVDDLKVDIDKMWKSSKGSLNVSYSVPKKVDAICFGEKNTEYEDDFYNVYFLPEERFPGGVLEHVDLVKSLGNKERLCIPAKDRKVSFVIDKDYKEILVTISAKGRTLTGGYNTGGGTSGGGGSNGDTGGNSGGGNTGGENSGGGVEIGDMVVVYYNNFEQDTLGSYKDSEIARDWDNGAYPISKKGHVYIEQDPSDSQNPSKYVRVFHKKGSWGGMSPYEDSGTELYHYMSGGYEELYFSYRIKIQKGFENYATKGKIPSMEGYLKMVYAGHCAHGDDGFFGSMQFVPVSGGVGIAPYIYHVDMWKNSFNPSMNYEQFGSTCDEVYEKLKDMPGYGGVYGSGSTIPGLVIKTGEWHTVTERIVVNDLGKNNGIVEIYLDGKLYSRRTDYTFRTVEELKINLLSFVSFFGGGAESAAVNDMNFYFDDFIAYYYPDSLGELSSSGTLPPIDYPEESILG